MSLVRALLTACLLLAAPAAPVFAAGEGDYVLNYRDADVRAFIDDVALQTGKTFIVDPRVNGKVTVVSHTEVSPDALFEVFLATLRVNGYSVSSLPSGAYKILPNSDAMLQAGFEVGADRDNSFVTEVFSLKHIDGIAALGLLKPIVHSDGRVVSTRGSKSLVVVDYATNMDRVREVIAKIDQDNSVYEAVPLRNTAASEMVRIVTALRAEGGEQGGEGGVSAVDIGSSNTIVLRGDARAVQRMVAFVQEMDGRTEIGERNVVVIKLRHAQAAELVPLLQSISDSIIQVGGEDGEGAPAPARAGRTGTHIAAHEATNSIVIHATNKMLSRLKKVVQELDQQRHQVLVEALIVEVSDQAAKELGVQYLLTGDGQNSQVPFTATNFSNSAPNILAAAGALIGTNELNGGSDDDSSGLNEALGQAQSVAISSLLGLSGFVGGGAGQTSGGTIFGAILTAIERDADSNILSTPSVMTLDNQQAYINVGQEVPITTGEALGANFDNPFRTVERQDVGVKLEVTPQIIDGTERVKMTIRQEVSSVAGTVTTASPELILNKREITSLVEVTNGGVAVLGGLIEENEIISVEKVPLLGDIPGVGRLFQSKARSKTKTNLMVFIRPTILYNAQDLDAVSAQKYDLAREQERIWNGREAPSTLDRFRSEVLNVVPTQRPAPVLIRPSEQDDAPDR